MICPNGVSPQCVICTESTVGQIDTPVHHATRGMQHTGWLQQRVGGSTYIARSTVPTLHPYCLTRAAHTHSYLNEFWSRHGKCLFLAIFLKCSCLVSQSYTRITHDTAQRESRLDTIAPTHPYRVHPHDTVACIVHLIAWRHSHPTPSSFFSMNSLAHSIPQPVRRTCVCALTHAGCTAFGSFSHVSYMAAA